MKEAKRQCFQIGDSVTVYNRFLFAIPVNGIVRQISSKDGSLSIVFDEDENRNVIKHNESYFFIEECRIRVEEKVKIKYWLWKFKDNEKSKLKITEMYLNENYRSTNGESFESQMKSCFYAEKIESTLHEE